MFKHLALLFACLLVFSSAQTCSESKVPQMETGLIELGVPTASFAQKQYTITFSNSSTLGLYSEIFYAFALAGFQAACNQDYYALMVDEVYFENLNTKMRFTMDYVYDLNSTNFESQWTKVKLTYIVVSSEFESYAAAEGGSYVWAGSVELTVNASGSYGPYGQGSIFGQTIDQVATSCGYLTNTPNNNSPTFDTKCPATDNIVPHYFIMGFKFQPGTYELAASAQIPNYDTGSNTVTFGSSSAQGFGPLVDFSVWGNGLKRIKVGIVLTTLVGIGSYPNTLQDFSYSSVYMPVNLYNQERPIIQGQVAGEYNLDRYEIPKLAYQIYGLSSFAINSLGNDCTSIDVNVEIRDLYTLIIQTDNTDNLNSVIVGAAFFSKNSAELCGVSTQPTTEMVDITRKTYTTVPDLQIGQQNVQQTSNDPMEWTLTGEQVDNGSLLVTYNLEIQFANFTINNAYRISTELKEALSYSAAFSGIDNPYVRFVTEVDGQVANDVTLNSSTFADYTFNFGIAIQTATPLIKFTVTIPRPTQSVNSFSTIIALTIEEYDTIYNPQTDCCADQCPAGSGINILSNPPACIVCEGDNSLVYNPATGACVCQTGFYNILQGNSNGGIVCFPCLGRLCSTCSVGTPTTCQTCVVGASFNSSNICNCNVGFYETNGKCEPCPARCSSCSTGGVCNECSDPTNRDFNQNCACKAGFYDDGSATCKVCNSICKTCNSSSTCTSCHTENNRTLVNGQCLCASGFFQQINTDNSVSCRKCNSECKECSGPNVCLDCDTKDHRVIGYDQIGHQTCYCAAGYSPLSDGTCVQNGCTADPYCKECDEARGKSVCIDCIASTNRVLSIPAYACVCAEGFFEQNGRCVACPSGCAKCSNSTVCERCAVTATSNNNGTCSCPSSYFFAVEPIRYCKRCNDYCLQCKNEQSCDQCLPTFNVTSNGKCICARGNYVNDQLQCVPCINNCTVCHSGTNCSLCAPGFYLQDNRCVSRCSPGFYISGVVCEKCAQGCSHCESAGACLVCEAGRFAYNGLCYVNCPSGSIADNSNLTCVACNSPCATCVQHPSKCLSCSSGNYFEFACHTNCPVGTYNNNGVCEYCSFECASCLGSANTCISCPDGQYLFEGSCHSSCPIAMVNGKCPNLCPNGFFTASNNNCVKCNDKCATCKDSASFCTSCVSGVANNGECVSTCPTATINVNGNCVACPEGCSGCSSADKCTTCASGYFLSGNRCLASCPSDAYRDGSNGCKKCPSTCKTCSGANFCTSCPDSRSQPINGVCYPCIYPCSTCTEYETCTSCISGFNLFNSRCTSNCPAGSRAVNGKCVCNSGVFQNGVCVNSCSSGFTAINNTCTKCNDNCAECGTTIDRCTACASGFILNSVTGKCQINTNCKYGEYFSSEEQRCKRICPTGTSFQDSVCLSSCLEGFRDNGFGGCIEQGVVTGCSFPYFFQQGRCVSTCSAGSFPNSGNRVCEACNSNCFSCMSAAFCTSCRSGFDLKDGICIRGQQCANNQLKYNGACLNTCPIGTIVSGSFCERRCPPNTYFHSDRCYSECPAGLRYTTDVACVQQCPSNYVLSGNKCILSVQSCPTGQFYNAQTGTCASCSYPCSECQFTQSYCTKCPNGMILTSNRCVESNSCGSGSYRGANGQCATCPVKCRECVSATECSTCANGYIFNGYDCILRVAQLQQVQMTQNSVSRRQNTVFISVKLSILPNGLTAEQRNNFFVVLPSSVDSVLKVNQWVSSTESNTVIVAIEYQTYPQLSTVFLALNAQLLATSYANIGYTATENSFLSVVVSTSVTNAPTSLTIPNSATNSKAQGADQIPNGNKALKLAVRQRDTLGN